VNTRYIESRFALLEGKFASLEGKFEKNGKESRYDGIL